MKRKVTKLFSVTLLALIVLFAYSCKKNNVKKIEVNNSFALSLLQKEVSINEMLDMMDSTSRAWIRVLPDKTVSAIFYDTIRDIISGAELLDNVDDIPIFVSNDVEVSPVIVPDSIQQIWASDPSYVFVFQHQFVIDNMFAVAFEMEHFIIDRLVMKDGDISLHLDVQPNPPLPVQVQSVTITSDNMEYISGRQFEVTSGNPGDVGQSLENMIITPSDGRILFSGSLTASVSIDKATYDAMGGQICGKLHVDVNGGFTDLKILNIDGQMEELSQPYSDSLEINFGINGVEGDLNLYRPELYIDYINTFGFGVNATVDSLGFYIDNELENEYTSLLKEKFDIYMEANRDKFTPVYSDISTHIVDYINMVEHYDGMFWKGKINIGSQSTDNLNRNSHIDLAAEAVIPLKININEMQYTDTLNFKIDGGKIDKFLQGVEFKFRMDNALPLKVMFQAYLMRENEITDSLLVAGENVIEPSYNGEYLLSEIISTVEGERIQNVLTADHILLQLSVTTEGNTVNIKSTNSMKIGIGMKTKTNQLDFDDVL